MSRFRPLLLAALLAPLLPLAAEQLPLEPDLGDALPWTDTPEGVKTTAPLLVNPATILPEGTHLRIFYVRPYPGDDGVGSRVIGTGGPKDGAYSRQSGYKSANGGKPDEVPKVVSDAVQAARKTVWPNIATFRASLRIVNSSDLRILYDLPGKTDLLDEPLSLVEGMLLAEKDGAVTVLAVLRNGNAAGAGIVAGDRLETFNGQPLGGALETFSRLYRDASATSSISKPKPYSFGVRHAGAAEIVETTLRPPPSLGGSLLDQ